MEREGKKETENGREEAQEAGGRPERVRLRLRGGGDGRCARPFAHHGAPEELEAATGQEARFVTLGHLQRGGTPSALDRVLATRFGVGAVRLITEGKFGHMVSYLNDHVGGVSIAQAVSKLRTVPPKSETVTSARSVGISFGDR